MPPQDRAQPVWAVEDRITYNRARDEYRQQQLEQQQRRMQALQEAQRQQQQLLDDFYERRMIQHPRQAVQWAENENRRYGEQRRQWQMIVDSTGFSDVNAARRAYDFPKSIEEHQRAARFLDLTQQSPNAAKNPLGNVVNRAAGIGNIDIPYANEAGQVLGQYLRQTYVPPLADVALEKGAGLIGDATGVTPATPGDVVQFAGENVLPEKVWQAVLELIPGVGTVPDAIRMIKSGSPDALRALDNVLGSEAAQSLRTRLASEYGGGPVGGPLGSGLPKGLRMDNAGKLIHEPSGMKIPHPAEGIGTPKEKRANMAKWVEILKESGIDFTKSADELTSGDEMSRLLTAQERYKQYLGIADAPASASAPARRVGNLGERTSSTAPTGPTSQQDLERAGVGAEGGPVGGPLDNLLPKADEAVVPAEVITGLEAQRANINRTLRSLKKTEAGRIKLGTVEDAFKVAERYERGSVQRAEILGAIEGQIADLPAHQQNFIRAAFETLPDAASRRAATQAQRAAQYASAEEAFDTTSGSAAERATAAFKARGGKQAQRFTPIGPRFDDDTHRLLDEDIINAARNGTISGNERDNAISALHLYMTGERLPGVVSEAKKPVNLMPSEIKLLGRIFGKEIEASLQMTKHVSRLRTVADLLNLPRAIVTAVDISAAGRQGVILLMRNPNEARKAFLPMFRAMASERGFEQAAKNITGNTYFDDAIRHGLDLTNIGGGPGGEEAFISGLVDKLPTWAGGGLVRGSERGYVTYLDTLRMLVYEKNAQKIERLAEKQGWPVERLDEVKGQVAKFFNHATGRGDLGAMNEYTPALNAVFFSPRYLVSRFQSIWDMVRPGADPVTRRIAFENLGMFVGTGMSILTAAKLSGLADVELDPRSPDFGKFRVGSTRVDFWGGYQPIARYMVQVASGDRKELFTNDIKNEFRGDIVGRFFRSKLSPAGAIFYDNVLNGGKTYEGDDTFFKSPSAKTAWSEFRNRLLPLSIQDAIEGYQSGGLLGAAIGGVVSAVGGGISNIEPSEQQQQEQEQSKAVEKYGAKLNGDDLYPLELDSAWNDPAWDTKFRSDIGTFLEGRSLSDFEDKAALKEAWVEYWWQEKGLNGALSEKARRKTLDENFEKLPAVQAWDKRVSAARLDFWRNLTPEQRTELGKLGFEPTKTQKGALGIE